MLTHSFWWLIVDALAVFRLTHLVVDDTITQPIRTRLLNGPAWMLPLATCSWCISFWIAGGAVALTCFYPAGWQYPAAVLALSGVAGILAEH